MKRLATVILAFLIATVSACSSDPDLESIRSHIRSMSVAAENHDADGIVRFLDPAYRGAGGNRHGVINLLQQHFSLNRNINVIISDIEIMLAEDRQSARVSLRVLMTGGESNLPERGRLSAIRSVWKKQNAQWQVIQAEWKPVLLSI